MAWKILGLICIFLAGAVFGTVWPSRPMLETLDFIGAILGAGAGIAAAFLAVRLQSGESRAVGRAILREFFDIANMAIANYRRCRDDGQVNAGNGNTIAGELDALAGNVTSLASAAEAMQATIPGAAIIKTVIVSLLPNVTRLKQALAHHPKESVDLRPEHIDLMKLLFDAKTCRQVDEIAQAIQISDRYLAEYADRFLRKP